MARRAHPCKTPIIRLTVKRSADRNATFPEFRFHNEWNFYISAIDVRHFLDYRFKFIGLGVHTAFLTKSDLLNKLPIYICQYYVRIISENST